MRASVRLNASVGPSTRRRTAGCWLQAIRRRPTGAEERARGVRHRALTCTRAENSVPRNQQFGRRFGPSTLRGAGATKTLSRRGRRLRDEPPLGARLAAQKKRIVRAGAHDHVGARAAPTRRDVEPVHATIVAALRPPILSGFHCPRIGRSMRGTVPAGRVPYANTAVSVLRTTTCI
jgi:hypothetical protein